MAKLWSVPCRPSVIARPNNVSPLLDRIGFCFPELRMRLAEDLYRIPDIAVFDQDPDADPPLSPPQLIVEVSSPSDSFHELLKKFEQYRQRGVQNIWLLEPELKKLYVYTGALNEVTQFQIANLTIAPADLFD